MLTPQQWERLARLNREVAGKLAEKVVAPMQWEPPQTAIKRNSLGGTQGSQPPQFSAPRLLTPLEVVLPGTVQHTAAGSYYLVNRGLEELCVCDELEQRFRRVLGGCRFGVAPDEVRQMVQPLLEAQPDRVAFLDIETCGFIGVPIFLVGLMSYKDGRFALRQLLARDYADERPLLCGLWDEFRGLDVIVTFNGKSFDLPVILDRSMVNGICDCPTPAGHVDLLHAARRCWKGVLPNCRLQTLERRVCGRLRTGDIPSSEIPAVYHAFVRSADVADPRERARCLSQLRAVIHHNALDLTTMAELLTHMLV